MARDNVLRLAGVTVSSERSKAARIAPAPRRGRRASAKRAETSGDEGTFAPYRMSVSRARVCAESDTKKRKERETIYYVTRLEKKKKN